MRTLNPTTVINDIRVDRNDRRVVIGTVEQVACPHGARVYAKALACAKAKPGAEQTAIPALLSGLLGLMCSLHHLVRSLGWHVGRQHTSPAFAAIT